MSRPKKSIDRLLHEAEVAIHNSLASDRVLTAVSPYGYDQPHLEAAQALLTEANSLVNDYHVRRGEQLAATEAVKQALAAATAVYADTITIARIAFSDNKTAQVSLTLTRRRQRNRSGWLMQAQQFYSNLLADPAFVAAMTAYSYDRAKLEAEAALVKAVDDATLVQAQKRGEAQDAIRARDAKLQELTRWLSDYKTIAHIALSPSPQLLEQLGWVVA